MVACSTKLTVSKSATFPFWIDQNSTEIFERRFNQAWCHQFLCTILHNAYVGINGIESRLNTNPRIALPVPDSLQSQVFPWLNDARELFFSDEEKSSELVTTRCFLDMLYQMQIVAIQDAAVMVLDHPERCKHQLFTLPVFQSQEFSPQALGRGASSNFRSNKKKNSTHDTLTHFAGASFTRARGS